MKEADVVYILKSDVSKTAEEKKRKGVSQKAD